VARFVGITAGVASKGGWTRAGSRGRFRYLDSRGRRITDPEKLERIEALAIPPAWKQVWISPRPKAKLQATGMDAAGRKQYIYHDDYRAAQEEAKFDKLVRFAGALPAFREAMSAHMELEPMSPEWTCAVAVRLINLGWFRVGEDRYAKAHKTFGITTLRRSHVRVRGSRIAFRFQGKQRIWVRTAVVDAELADAMRELLRTRGPRLFRYRLEGETYNLTARRLNDYIAEFMGEEFTAKDFRTWGGTLIAAVSLAERGPAESEAEAKRAVVAVMRTVGERLGNTPAVARASYVSPAVVEQYLDGRTIDDYRPRNLRVVGARELGLNVEEQSVLSLLRSWRIRCARKAA
jgi:DNA topoisomerase I